MENATVSIVRKSFQAYVDKDRAAIEALMADDLRFTSPLDNGIDRKTYFERCWPISKTVASFDFIYLLPDGDRVVATYESRNMDGRRFRNTEIFTVRNGQIVAVEVYFGWPVPHEAPAGGFVPENKT